mgnify:CR=1 FL=1
MIDLTEAAFTRHTSYTLIDISGRRLRSGISRERRFRLSLEGLERGIYLLRLFDGNGLELKTTKVLVQ